VADTAFQTAYRQEFIAGFEQRQSLLRQSTTTEAVVKGNTATFLVADSGGATANTRGTNGLIPAVTDNLTQKSASLAEWHDLRRRTDYNIFASQGDGRRIMQENTMAVINRKCDSDIIDTLNTGTQTLDSGAGVTFTLAKATTIKTILGNAGVPHDGQLTAVITPAVEAYLIQNVPQFSSQDYVTARPVDTGELAWSDQPKMYSWLGFNWIVHPNLPGKGTSAEKCFFYHRSAIGHAFDTGDTLDMAVGYDDEQKYSWARCSTVMGSVLLQNSGLVVYDHDGSGLTAD